jgi:hypothetical protein
MANGIIEAVTKVTLILDEEEAKFIKSMVQNSLEETESVEVNHIRSSIFNALKDIQL